MTFDGARARVAAATGLAGAGVTTGDVTTAINDALSGLAIPSNVTDLDDVSGAFTAGDLFQYDGSGFVPHTPAAITVVGVAGFLVDGGGAAITTGVKGDLPQFPFAGTITGVAASADQSGSVAFQFWKDSWANYPPVVGDSLGTLTLSSQTKSPTTGTWTTVNWPFSAGDVVRINCSTGATSITRVTLSFRIEREVGP